MASCAVQRGMGGKVKVVVRKYEKADHELVCKLFYNGMVENWPVAYRGFAHIYR